VDEAAAPIERVTTLELFFDLVFAFTITQLTSVLSRALTWRSMWHVLVTFGIVFWMYGGYAWLTNAVPAHGRKRRSLLLGGMAGYMVLAISIPDVFTRTGLAFGLAYLVITLIHAWLYITQAGENSAAAIRALAPGNLLAAILVLVSGAIGGTVQEIAWTATFLGLWFLSKAGEGFEIGPAHFVERHALLILIAIGESVVATGIGTRGLGVNVSLLLAAVLGLLVSMGLFWAYFGEEDDHIERAFTAASGPDRIRMAFYGFGYAHYVLLLAIVFTADGLRLAVEHPGSALTLSEAFALAGGVAAFLFGEAWFLEILGLRSKSWKDISLLAVLVAVPIGTGVSAGAAVGVTAAVLLGTVAYERGRARSA
jgi:low temperature requirement protein LtrA